VVSYLTDLSILLLIVRLVSSAAKKLLWIWQEHVQRYFQWHYTLAMGFWVLFNFCFGIKFLLLVISCAGLFEVKFFGVEAGNKLGRYSMADKSCKYYFFKKNNLAAAASEHPPHYNF